MLLHKLLGTSGGDPNLVGVVQTNTNSYTVTLNPPATAQVGDLIVGFAYAESAGTLWSSTYGFTFTNASNSTAPRLTAFYKEHDGSSSYTISQNNTGAAVSVIMVFVRNKQFDLASSVSAAADPVVISSVTASNNDSIQLITAGGNTQSPVSIPTGFVQLAFSNSSTGPQFGVYYKPSIASGATGTISVDMTGSSNTSGMQVILKPI